MRSFLFSFLLCLFTQTVAGQAILPLKERAIALENIQKERLEKLLPALMKEHNIDCWVIITREYNEDPVLKTLLPPTWLNARRRTILVFTQNKKTGEVERAAMTRYPFGKLIDSKCNKEKEPDQF